MPLPTSTLRRPYMLVEVDGRQVTTAFSFRASFGYDLNVSECTVSLPAPPSWANYWSVVGIRAGANQASAQTRYVGFLLETDYTLYPRECQLVCRGPLVRAQLVDCNGTGGVDLSASGAGQTDQAIVQQLLNACGLTNPGPVALNIGGLGRVIGTIATKYTVWTENQKALDAINQLDKICLGYRTFDTVSGGIARQQIVTATPAATAALTFTEGVDIFSATPQVSVLQARNRVQVTGYDPGKGTGAFSYDLEQSNPLLPLGWVTDQISNNMIEKSLTTDGTSGVGIAAQEVATWWIGEVNRALGKYTFTTPRDDYITPGMTIAINSPNRLGVNQNFWVQHVDIEIDAKGQFTQQLVAIAGLLGIPGTGSSVTLGTPSGGVIGSESPSGPGSGTGTTGSGGGQGTSPPATTPPTADFAISIQQETVLISGAETVLYEVQCTSSSVATSGTISTYAWTASAGSPASGSDDTFVTTLTSITGSQTVTLTVTDSNSNTASLTQTIALPTNSSQAPVRLLYLAGTDCIEAFDGAIWHSQAESYATIATNAPAWGASGLGTGGVWTSTPSLATVNFANVFAYAPVSALWVETNINPKRILAGSGTGEVAISNDGGTTWTQAAQNVPGSISVLRCVISSQYPNQWFALTTAGLYRTDNAGAGWVTVMAAASGETFTDFVLSFARDMIVMTGGRGMVDFAGHVQTFPSGMTGAIAIAAHIRKDRFYVYDGSGNTALHTTNGATTLTAGAALPAGSTPQPRGLWRDGSIVDLLYIAAGANVWKSVDGMRTSGNYYALRTAGVSTSPAGAVYTQVGADGQLVVPPLLTPQTIVSSTSAKAMSLWNGTSNNTPPYGWQAIEFNDSAWSAAVVVSEPYPWTAIWSENPALSNTEQALLRQKFTLPSGRVTSVFLSADADDGAEIWINGVFVVNLPTPAPGDPDPSVTNFPVPPSILLPGAVNVIATLGINRYPSQAAVAYNLVVS